MEKKKKRWAQKKKLEAKRTKVFFTKRYLL